MRSVRRLQAFPCTITIMPSGSLQISRANAIQLGAVAALGIATIASGGTLAPLLIAVLGTEGPKKAGEAALGFAINVLSGIFSDEVQGRLSAADKARRSKQNHDVQRAINTAIASCLQDAAETYSKSVDGKNYLKATAAAMLAKPLTLQLTPGTDAIDEARVTTILSGDANTIRNAKPLTARQWEVLVGQYAHALGKETMQVALEHAAGHLQDYFSANLVQVLKEAGAESDPAWFAVVLRFLGEIHADIKEIKSGTAAIKADTASLKANAHAQSVHMQALTGAFNQHQESVRQAFEKLHTTCTARVGAVPAEQLAADREQLSFIHTAVSTLAADLPAMKEALGRIEGTLATVLSLLKDMAGAVSQVRDLMAAYGMVGLVQPNIPGPPMHLIPRPQLLQDLRDVLLGTGRTALTGQAVTRGSGGQGKTVLSQWYRQKYGKEYSEHCFQINMESQPLVRSLAALLTESEATRNLTDHQKARMVLNRLSQPPACLLILDNLPDEEVWSSLAVQGGTVEINGQQVAIPPLLPVPPCHVIITTRAEHLPGVRGVDVGSLTEHEGADMLALFAAEFGLAFDAAAAKRITAELGGLALAVAAVGADLALDRRSDWAVYADNLVKVPLDALPESRADIQKEIRYTGRITAVLDALYHKLPAAEQRVMDYTAVLPPDGMPGLWLELLLRADADPARGESRLDLGQKPSGAPRAAADVLDHLRRLDVLTAIGEEGRFRRLHRLHAKRCRERMAAKEGQATALLLEIAACAAARRATIIGTNPDGTDRGVDNPAAVTDQSLRWELTPLAETCKALWLADHPGPAARVGVWLAGVLRLLGRYAEAAACLQLTTQNEPAVEAEIGPEDLAACYSNLATIQQDQGDLPGARQSVQRAIAGLEARFGKDYINLGSCYSNLALIQQAQGDLPGARASMERAIAIESKHFAPDHPTFAIRYSNLALIQQAQGDLPGARASMERAIAIDSKHFAPDHPTFAIRYSNLATIQKNQGDLPGARASMERAIAIGEQHLGKDHPNIAAFSSNLATIQQAQGDLPGARASMERAIAIKSKHFAPDNPTFAATYNNLAHICFAEGDRAAACANFKKALDILLKHFDENHPDVMTIRRSMQNAGCGQ